MAYRFNPFTGKLDGFGPVLTGTGTVSAADGTAALPGIAFASDLNTGIYRPGADQVAISTNSLQRLAVDASGNINIDSGGVYYDAVNNRLAVGTTSPQFQLQVVNGGIDSRGSGQGLTFRNNIYYSAGDKYLTGSGAASTQYFDGSGNIIFYNTGTSSTGADSACTLFERARIDSSGRLGLGTSSPTSTLHVDKDTGSTPTVYINNSGVDAGDGIALKVQASQRGTSVGDASVFSVHNNASEIFTVRNDGNVGIGTTSPEGTLHVNAGGTYPSYSNLIFKSSANYETTLYLNNGSPGHHQITANAYTEALTINAPYSAQGNIRFNTAGSERARIDSSGRLLVGTSSSVDSASTLQVKNGYLNLYHGDSATNSGYGIRFSTDGGATGLTHAQIGLSQTAGNGGTLLFSTTADGASSTTERMRISNAGTTTITSAAATAPFVAKISTSEVARIDSSGRLLVGTSTSSTIRGIQSSFQLASNGAEGSSISIYRYDDAATDANSPRLILARSGGTSLNNTIVGADNVLGEIAFCGADGVDLATQAALIKAEVDGTPGSDDMPGRLVFSVTADGASSPTEAMRIKNSRIINIANTPVYADNAAAKTGGLVDGDVYRTSTGDLKIVYT